MAAQFNLVEGQVGAPFEIPLEEGKLWEFALATGAVDPPASVRIRPPVVPTFLVTAAFWYQPGSWLLEQAAADWSRLLSGGSVFEVHGPALHPGELLRARQEVESVYTKVGRRSGEMQFIEFRTDFWRPDGLLAATERHTSIATIAPPRQPGATSADGDNVRVSPAIETRSVDIEDLKLGDQLPILVDQPVDRTRIVRYQAASGDFNPIHHDDDFARRAGYPSVFSVGMFHAGILGGHLTRLFGSSAIRRFGVRFRQQVWPGDVLTYGGVVEREEIGEGGRMLDLTLTAGRDGAGAAVVGGATVRIGGAR